MEKENYIEQIIDKIISEAGLSALPEEANEAFKKQMEIQIMRRLGLIIVKNLDDRALEKFGELQSEELSPEKYENFLKENLPDYENILKNEIQILVDEIIGASKK